MSTPRTSRTAAADRTKRRKEIVDLHGDGMALCKQVLHPADDGVMVVFDREHAIGAMFWSSGECVVDDPTLRFVCAHRGDLIQTCKQLGLDGIARALSARVPSGYVLLAVFAAGGGTVALTPELDVSSHDSEAALLIVRRGAP